MICEKCGSELEENALFCRFCGNKIEQETVSTESNKINVYGIDEDLEEEPESDLSVNYSEKSSDNQNTEDAETEDTVVSDKTSDEKI